MGREVLVMSLALTGVAAISPAWADQAVSKTSAVESPVPVTQTGQMLISMEFQDAALRDVLKTFSRQTGLNVIASAEVGDQPVTVYLENVQVLDALGQILAASGLTYERPLGSDIYIVKPKPKDAEVLTETRVYRLKYARVSESILARAASKLITQTPFEAKLDSSQSVGSSSSGSESGTSEGGGAAQQATVVDMGIDKVIQKLLTKHGAVVVDGRTNSLIITDVPENFPRLEAAIAVLDVRTPQIMVDAEIIETSLNKIKDLGVEWGTGSEGTLFQLTPAKRTSRFPYNWVGDRGRRANPGAASMTLGTVDTAQAVAALQALETDTDSKILARPKVLTLDNESAVIRLTSDETIGFETSSQTQTGTTGSKPERTTTGIVLVVTPQINADGFITMIVEPSVTKTVASNVSPPSGQATPRDPKTRSARALVRVRTGDTLVVGGLIDRSDQHGLRKVPILGDIPVIGQAFKDVEINDVASELIVFVTPRIIQEQAAGLAATPPSPWQPAQAGTPSSMVIREQQASPQEEIEAALNRLEQTPQ